MGVVKSDMVYSLVQILLYNYVLLYRDIVGIGDDFGGCDGSRQRFRTMSLRQARERFGSDCMDTMESMTRMEKEWFLLGSCLYKRC
jgi:hypothetical protein